MEAIHSKKKKIASLIKFLPAPSEQGFADHPHIVQETENEFNWTGLDHDNQLH